jgi:hypothetical protein
MDIHEIKFSIPSDIQPMSYTFVLHVDNGRLMFGINNTYNDYDFYRFKLDVLKNLHKFILIIDSGQEFVEYWPETENTAQ